MSSAMLDPPLQRQPIPDKLGPCKQPELSQRIPKLVPRRRGPQVASKEKRSISTPIPETPPLPCPLSSEEASAISYTHPIRRILSPGDHELYLESATHTMITGWVFNISDSVKDTSISQVREKEQSHPDTGITSVLKLLEWTGSLVEEWPASENGGSRFGNPVFKEYMADVLRRLPSWLNSLFPSLASPKAIEELASYFHSSLGSALRVDYGSGHELHFFVFLLCLYRLSLISRSSLDSIALILLPAYLGLMRRLQSTYYLEPAGSHGVWGLDDYHFLPFLVGASQLQMHPFIRPLGIHSSTTIEAYAADYLYLDMVRALSESKTVRGLRWHSPMLDDISGVREGWAKIYGGLKKMLLGEVLGKLVVMQHFLFGSIIPFPSSSSSYAGVDKTGGETIPSSSSLSNGCPHHHHHHHHHQQQHQQQEYQDGSVNGKGIEMRGWDDCCGIRVPSYAGAAGEESKRGGTNGRGQGQTLRPLPFD